MCYHTLGRFKSLTKVMIAESVGLNLSKEGYMLRFLLLICSLILLTSGILSCDPVAISYGNIVLLLYYSVKTDDKLDKLLEREY